MSSEWNIFWRLGFPLNFECSSVNQPAFTFGAESGAVLESIGHLSMLMSFKLADMVNIALDEGNYFRSEEWCKQNGSKMMVEH